VKLDMPKKVDKVTKKSLESIRQHIEPKDLISRVKADADKRRK
jgi:hypothetical protein